MTQQALCLLSQHADDTHAEVRVYSTWFVDEVICYRPKLRAYLRSMGLQQADAEDLCQEALLHMWASCVGSRPRHVRAFLFKTARNLVIDRRRSAGERQLQFVEDLEASNKFNELSPERYVCGALEYERLSSALMALGVRQRQVLWLRRVDNLSLKSIARQLNIAPHTVEQHIRKALRLTRMYIAA
ncbi:MAG: sigma-70 family RNA polymerase sigma factor [Gammaproteobacteria bacterium]